MMDYVYSDLLGRDEIVYVLTKRHLDISDMERLSENELLRIYKSFAVPLPRRELRRLHTAENSEDSALNNNNNNNDINYNYNNNNDEIVNNNDNYNNNNISINVMEIEGSIPGSTGDMDVDEQLKEETSSLENSKTLNNENLKSPNGREKRHLAYDCDTMDYISSATKRIKINSVNI